jgi:hypothetical protein
MSRNRSLRTQKRRYGRRKSKRHAASVAKPASPGPGSESAKPASVNPTSPPKSAPKLKSPPSLSLVRRAAHKERKLTAKVRLLEKQVTRLLGLEKHLGRALEQLAAARTQIGELNTAMHYLLAEPPHNGRYRHKVRRPMLTPFFLLNLFSEVSR